MIKVVTTCRLHIEREKEIVRVIDYGTGEERIKQTLIKNFRECVCRQHKSIIEKTEERVVIIISRQ